MVRRVLPIKFFRSLPLWYCLEGIQNSKRSFAPGTCPLFPEGGIRHLEVETRVHSQTLGEGPEDFTVWDGRADFFGNVKRG